MAQWGKNDQANNVPNYVPAQLKQKANTGNAEALYGNTTATGVIAVDANEITADGGKIAHTGWILRKVNTGNRSGRVQTEVLIAGGITGDSGSSDGYAQAVISISTHPASKNVADGLATTFTVVATSVPTTTLSYLWQANTGSGFANLTNAGVYSNVTTATLAISNVAGLTGVQYRVRVSATGATTVNTNAATLTVTA